MCAAGCELANEQVLVLPSSLQELKLSQHFGSLDPASLKVCRQGSGVGCCVGVVSRHILSEI